MGIDQFFSFGPEAPFASQRVFTDREEHIRFLHERLVDHGERTWTAGQLLDFQRPAGNLVVVAGEGGIGKSTLARHVVDLAVRGTLPGLAERRAGAVLDFADPVSSSFEALLLRVRAGLGGLARSWPAFDIALAVYWERKHPGESLTALLARTGSAESSLMADQISTTVDQVLGGFGAISVAYRVLDRLGRTAAHRARLKRLRATLPALDPILTEQDPDLMLGYMPALLAADLERVRARRRTLALCVLDTVETLQALPAERGGLEDLVSRLVYLTPNVLFVAAGRAPLRWHEPIRAVGLTYGGAHRWPGLAGPDRLDLGGFDAASAEAYLATRLTVDDRPVIEPPIRRRIIAGSAGSPLYLDLSAGLYEQYLARGVPPRTETFGLGFPELVLRMMRDLSGADRDLLRAAALLEAFDTDVLCAVLPGLRRRTVETFTARPFVRRDETVWPPYRLHESLRRSVIESDAVAADGWTATERRQHADRAVQYLAAVSREVWDEHPANELPMAERSRRGAAAFLLALRAAYEHRLLPPVLAEMAYSLSVLGHRQILASLPELADAPELARLTAVARLMARGDVNTEDRYQAMRRLVGEVDDSPFADYHRYELGSIAHILGRLPEATGYLSAISPSASLIGAGALFGLADNALRRGDHREVTALMGKASDASLDRIRVADLLGHTLLQNARFEEAAAQFETTLAEARNAGAPLWEARAMRHLALALMWYDPVRTLALTPQARELNESVGELVGVAQCDLAAALAHALHGDLTRAAGLLEKAAVRYAELGASRELVPVEAVRVLLRLAEGDAADAHRTAQAARADCLPVWAAVTGLWTGLHPLPTPDWLDGSEPTRGRWLAVADRVRAAANPVCGRLDVADRAGHIPTGKTPARDLARVAEAALASPAFDGGDSAVTIKGAIHGRRTLIKLQRRRHERLETVLRFERLRLDSGIRAPRLLDHGTVPSPAGPLWWAVLELLPGDPVDRPTPAQQRELGRQLRRWHARRPDGGLRLDDPGALGVFLGWARRTVPRAYPAIAAQFDTACAGQPMTALHGDIAVCHNALYSGDTLTAVLDPGAVEYGPPLLDLAFALAVDLPRGGTAGPLIDGYGPDAVDPAALDALLELTLLRRLIDTPDMGVADTDGRWIQNWLRQQRPDLLDLIAGEFTL